MESRCVPQLIWKRRNLLAHQQFGDYICRYFVQVGLEIAQVGCYRQQTDFRYEQFFVPARALDHFFSGRFFEKFVFPKEGYDSVGLAEFWFKISRHGGNLVACVCRRHSVRSLCRSYQAARLLSSPRLLVLPCCIFSSHQWSK